MSEQWAKARLGEVLRLDLDRVPVDSATTYPMVGVLSFGRGLFDRKPIENGKTSYRVFYRLKNEHVVMSQLFGWEGALALSSERFAGKFLSPQFPTFLCDTQKLDRTFLGWLMRRPAFWGDLGSRASGMGDRRRTLNPEALFSCEIPLPRLAEQRQIVARIEKLAAQVNKAHALRQQSAEEAEALVGALANRLFSELADHVSVEDVSEVRGGIQKSPNRTPNANPVRYLTVAHVQRNQVLVQDPRFFEVTPSELDRWRLKSGDVLIIEGNGSADQIGRAALFRGEIADCVHQNHVIRIRPNTSRIAPEFLNAFLNSPAGQNAVQAQSRTTSGLRTLSVGRIKQIQVPLPALSKQDSIVAELNTLQAEVDQLKRMQSETSAELDALLPAILDRAFRGEL